MPGLFRIRLPWRAAPRPKDARAGRLCQPPRTLPSPDRSPPPAAAGEDRGAAVEDLFDAWIEAAEGALSANTRRALKADLRIYRAWCAETGRRALPGTAETVATFVDAMAATRAPATVRRYVASIAAAHRATGCPETPKSPQVKLALKRMHRGSGRRQAQAPGLTWPLRQAMLEAPGDRLIDVRNRALLAVAYDTMLRRSELTALRVCDLALDRTGAATVLARASKTDAEGEGAVLYIAPDSLALVAEWLELSGVRDGRLFRSLCRGQLGEGLDPSQIPRIYKAMARRAGIEQELAGRLSGHSPRVGAAQDMVAHGIELPAIQQAGRWKTPAMAAAAAAPRSSPASRAATGPARDPGRRPRRPDASARRAGGQTASRAGCRPDALSPTTAATCRPARSRRPSARSSGASFSRPPGPGPATPFAHGPPAGPVPSGRTPPRRRRPMPAPASPPRPQSAFRRHAPPARVSPSRTAASTSTTAPPSPPARPRSPGRRQARRRWPRGRRRTAGRCAARSAMPVGRSGRRSPSSSATPGPESSISTGPGGSSGRTTGRWRCCAAATGCPAGMARCARRPGRTTARSRSCCPRRCRGFPDMAPAAR